MTTVDLSESRYGDSYGRDIRSAVRSLWNGALDYYQFFDAMIFTIRRGLTQAWHEGAGAVGVLPSELTPDEQTALLSAIVDETNQINNLAVAVEAGSKANGGKLEPLLQRAGLWALRYLDVVNRAKMMASTDPKLTWRMGPTSDHCPTCARMDGKTKRASFWTTHGPHPQMPDNPTIECRGWRCLCTMEPTQEKCSPGPLPHWP